MIFLEHMGKPYALKGHVRFDKGEARRNEQPEKAAFDTEAVFIHVTKFFEAPEASEGLNILEFSGKEGVQ
ncbi:hypothetical protein [Bacillus sp. V5-8f]|uniref:hypothetical protein n=1 Tax=Bacillus sp. V5-8f TaxID=2053044 RepID=UPI0021553FAC|nr:hypothetical protein [Bacillus sp. V5-8f]